MAIAGIVVLTMQGCEQAVRERLSADPGITDVRVTHDPHRLAAVLEASSRLMEEEIARLIAWDGVLTVDLAMISYEDELADGKEIERPPHRPRKRRQNDVPQA